MSNAERRLDLLKTLGDNTRYAIYLELARSPRPLSTSDVADSLGLHPTTVRPHLERMRDVARRYFAGRQVIWVDVHTALGEYGTAECIVELDPASHAFAVAGELWGARVSNLSTGGSLSVAIAAFTVSQSA